MWKPKTGMRYADKGLKALKRTLETVKHGDDKVSVGILGSSEPRKGEDLTNVEIGIVHEFGAPEAGIPERSFLRAGLAKHSAEHKALVAQMVPLIIQQKLTVARALGLLGAKAAADVKKFIRDGEVKPPDSPATEKKKQKLTRKGSKGVVKTLVDTGQLLTSISWEIAKKGAK